MAPPEATRGRDTGALAERLRFAGGLTDACYIVLEHVLTLAPAERAVLLVRAEGELRGAAYGLDERRFVSALEGPIAASQELRDWIDAGEPHRLRAEELLTELGLDECLLLPYPGPRGIPSGALLVEPDAAAGVGGALERLLAAAGPDLTRIAQTEVLHERLARSERRGDLLDSVVNSFADPVVLTDARNNFLFTNARAEALLYAGPDESEGRRRAVRINDLLFSSFLTQATIGGADAGGRDLNLVDPTDGSDLLFEVLTLPLPDGVVEEDARISILRDITDLKRALSELEVQFNRSRVAERGARQESDRMGVILASVGDPILVTDEASKIILTNQEGERLFDEAHREDGRPPSRRAVRANDTKITTLMSDFLLQPDQRRQENLILQDPFSGDELPVEVVSSKILDQRGELTAVVSILHDLTEMVENERLARELQVLNEGLEERIRLATEELEERNRRLEFQQRELQKASRLKSEFLASMTHELRTPINAMLGYTALMREGIYGELNDKQEGALGKVYGSSQHLLALINDILDLSKIEAGRMPVRVESVRLEPLVGELSQTIEPMIRERSLDYRAELADDLPVMETDRTKVKQILLNLLSNAVKFTSEGGVTIRAFPLPGGDRVRIEVEDTGIGIAPEELETIFDDFRQVDQSATRRYGGTGLGLSITRKLVTLLNGRIEVDSTVDEGSVFRVDLPVVLPEPPGGEVVPGEDAPDGDDATVREEEEG